MARLIHTIALAAASVVLAVGLWKGWGLWAAGRRMVLAYLGFFFLGAALTLVMRLVPLFERPGDAAARRRAPPPPRGRQGRQSPRGGLGPVARNLQTGGSTHPQKG